MHRLSSCSKTNIVFTCACTHTHTCISSYERAFSREYCMFISRRRLRKGWCFHRLLSVLAIIKTVCSTVILTQIFGATVNNSCQVVGVMIVDMWVHFFKQSLFKWPEQTTTCHVCAVSLLNRVCVCEWQRNVLSARPLETICAYITYSELNCLTTL